LILFPCKIGSVRYTIWICRHTTKYFYPSFLCFASCCVCHYYVNMSFEHNNFIQLINDWRCSCCSISLNFCVLELSLWCCLLVLCWGVVSLLLLMRCCIRTCCWEWNQYSAITSPQSLLLTTRILWQMYLITLLSSEVWSTWNGAPAVQTLWSSHMLPPDYPRLVVLTCLIKSTRPQGPLSFVTHYAWLGQQTCRVQSLLYRLPAAFYYRDNCSDGYNWMLGIISMPRLLSDMGLYLKSATFWKLTGWSWAQSQPWPLIWCGYNIETIP
jgi:hypothetical protein